MSTVTLTTDFGTRDGYVAEMKGVLLSLCPSAEPVDVTHEIEPGDVESAAWILHRIWGRFPSGTVHLVVVDPGVGSERLPLAVEIDGRWFVGPDNGLLSRVLRGAASPRAWRIDQAATGPPASGSTFHGRDVFAPAAARLASGASPDELGVRLEPDGIRRLSIPPVQRTGDAVRGRVEHVDRFGNLVTDIPAHWVSPTALVEVGGEVISGIHTHYGSVPSGHLLAVIGSGGTLEISVRNGSAETRLDVGRGVHVRVRTHRD